MQELKSEVDVTGVNLKKNLTLVKFRNAQYHQKYSQTIISEKQDITDIHILNSHILNFYENLFLDKFSVLHTANTFNICAGKLTQKKIYVALASIASN